ncbi:MAG: methyltransferase [Gemmataceae bacterium]
MAKRRTSNEPLPACYGMTHLGLEPIASEELSEDFGAEVKRTSPGIVVFRVDDITKSLLKVRTTEDIFLLGWGSDQLTFRAADLRKIQKWTAEDVKWDRLLQIHHTIRPKPSGKPTYRLVAQMTGKHGYRRVDALKALAKGLGGKLPSSWKHAEENASIEIWLTIHGRTAVCGVRLSDRTMRHRKYKQDHMPASLRPTMAAAMVRMSGAKVGDRVLDPMCGAGTILAEHLCNYTRDTEATFDVLGGDIELEPLRNTKANLKQFPEIPLALWDGTRLPLQSKWADYIISNPPFGKQIGKPEEIGDLYFRMVVEYHRVLKNSGKAVLLVSDFPLLKRAANARSWQCERNLDVKVLGQRGSISVWRK